VVLWSRKAGEWSRTHDIEPQDAQLSWRFDAQGEREGFERNPTGAGINRGVRSGILLQVR